jgi:hypothetical protein
MQIEAKIIDSKKAKILVSKDYNYIFNKEDGRFIRWGKTKDVDPEYSPFGPEILDIEVSCGKCSGKCSFCYKGNGDVGGVYNMTLDTFKVILNKMPKTLTQVAFGICDIDTNRDFFPMMAHAREKGIIPNYTCNGHFVTDEVAEKTSKLCGAVAVSIVDKEQSYDAIAKFIKHGMKQVNIHQVLSLESYDNCLTLADDIINDERLKGLNAVVFLQYKDKNKKCNYHSMLDEAKYLELYRYFTSKGVGIGFDSCSCNLFLRSIKDEPNYQQISQFCEPCESFGMFSSYINCKGEYYPCSFSENVGEWAKGLNVLECEDFIKDIWNNPLLLKYRSIMIKNGRNCPIYKI